MKHFDNKRWRNRFLAGFLAAILASPIAAEDTDTEGKIAKAITGEILGAVQSQALSLFKNFIVSQIFESPPDFATLSLESLEDIRDIVQEEVGALLTHFEQSEARSLLFALQINLGQYHASIDGDQFNETLLTFVATDSADLITDSAFSEVDFPNSFFFMADTYALAAALRMAILTEDYLRGRLVDFSYINDQADLMADTLSAMRQGIGQYVNARVTFKEHASCGYAAWTCTWLVRDHISGLTRSFSILNATRADAINYYVDRKRVHTNTFMSIESRETLNNLRAVENHIEEDETASLPHRPTATYQFPTRYQLPRATTGGGTGTFRASGYFQHKR